MAEGPERHRSWWQSVPGALTALAGLITAVTGLFVAFNQLGILGGDPDGPSMVATSDPQGTAAGATTFESAAGYSVAFPEGPLATVADAVYEIVEAGITPRNPDEVTLSLTVRTRNNYFATVGFSNDNFLLVVDGLDRAPVGDLYEFVPKEASMQGVVVFAIPEAGGNMLLRLRHHQEEVKLPLEVRPG